MSTESYRKTYSKKLLDPRWQKKRLDILNRDEWRCQACFDDTNTLHVHHRYYTKGAEPWEYEDEALVSLCKDCHAFESREMPKEEAQLLYVVREHLLSAVVNELSCGIHDVLGFKLHMPEVVVASLAHLMSDRDRMHSLIESYLVVAEERDK